MTQSGDVLSPGPSTGWLLVTEIIWQDDRVPEAQSEEPATEIVTGTNAWLAASKTLGVAVTCMLEPGSCTMKLVVQVAVLVEASVTVTVMT